MKNGPRFETSRCKTCSRPIIWTRSPRGALLPLDARPVHVYSIEPEGDGLAARTVRIPDTSTAEAVHDEREVAVYISHFPTCPQASEHWTRVRTRARPGARPPVAKLS